MSDITSEKLQEFLKRIIGYMQIECDVVATIALGGPLPLISATIQTPASANFLIGKNGQNLAALEHVVRAMLARHELAGASVTVDVNDYRKIKAQQITDIAQQAATRVRDTGKSEALPPMSSYERRIVHTELASWSDVVTESVGVEPLRRVVIKPL